MPMDPMTAMLISSGIGAGAGLLAGSGDPTIDLGQFWGKALADPVRDLQNEILNLPAQEFFPGQTYANLRPAQSDAYRAMIGYGQPGGLGADILSGTSAQGLAGLSSLGGGLDYLTGLEAPQYQFDQGTFNQVMGNLAPGLPGAYNEATRDITRNLNWDVLPGINTAASMSGNMASSRAGVAEGVAQGMAQDRMADVGSQLYQNALNQATQAATGASMGNLRADLGTQGNVLQGYGQFANLGLPGMGNAFNLGKNLMDLQLAGGTGFQQQDQLALQDQINRWNFEQQAPYNQYADIFSMLRNTIPGGAGVAQPSQFSQAMQGALAGMGIYGAGQEAGWWGQPNPLNTANALNETTFAMAPLMMPNQPVAGFGTLGMTS